MTINELDKRFIFKKFLPLDKNGREINIFLIRNSQLIGDLFYPSCLIYSRGEIINPINEKIMSLKNIKEEKLIFNISKIRNTFKDPVFFFMYNTDNYYHFIYDTLPYLITFIKLKEINKNIKLLMSYPNFQSNNFYPFVKEFLSILKIEDDDIVISSNDTLYEEIYISSSYTHGIDSNLEPREEIFDFYRKIVDLAKVKFDKEKKYPDKIYISRRTWTHNDFSNIGTNYTSKRKLVNEDNLVDFLKSKGYVEVFTEKMTTIEKIQMFSNVNSVIGAIGGGLCNILFSKENVKLTAIISPTFLDINKRFLHSFSKVKFNLFQDTSHIESGNWKKYMRVQTNNGVIGEIEDIYDDKLLITHTSKKIAGWNSQLDLTKTLFNKSECNRLDDGLNSPWIVDLDKIKIAIYE